MLNSIPKWTQDQAIAFECAREILTHVIGIYTAEITEATKKALSPSAIERLEVKLEAVIQERNNLRVTDDVTIERVCRDYGEEICSWNLLNSSFSIADDHAIKS